MESDPSARLRALPPAHVLLDSPAGRRLAAALPHAAARAAVRRVLDALRAELLAGSSTADRDALTQRAHALLENEATRASTPRLRSVLNATGVVLHTNLGRAPLGDEVIAHVSQVARGYATLEYDLAQGRRGHRDRLVSELCASLLGTEDALVVNNCAAAVLIAATALAAGREVVVSRGELVEIGGGFRVPEIIAACGARLVEVGTTNRTRAADYERALSPTTAMMLKVHRSNFALVGFTAEASVAELAEIGRARAVPVVVDIGSGAMVDTRAFGLPHEPTPAEVLAEGADLVMFSGDKLLGGPQAGILAGKRALIDTLRKHPLARATRPGRIVFAALEATLRAYAAGRAHESIPVVAMLSANPEVLRARAEGLAREVQARARVPEGVALAVERVEGRVGGGAMPTARLESWAVAVRVGSDGAAAALERALRERADPPVIARVGPARVWLDVRTLGDGDVPAAADGLATALAAIQEIISAERTRAAGSEIGTDGASGDDGRNDTDEEP